MTTSTLFMTFLHDVMSARRITFNELTYELEGIRPAVVWSWLEGRSSPDPAVLPDVARALRTDLTEVATGWLIDRLPELHEPLYKEVLKPRGSLFPHRDDLAVRAVERRWPSGECMDVGDPHDLPVSGGARSEARAVRRRPARCAGKLI